MTTSDSYTFVLNTSTYWNSQDAENTLISQIRKMAIYVSFKFLKIVGDKEAKNRKKYPQSRSARLQEYNILFYLAISTV